MNGTAIQDPERRCRTRAMVGILRAGPERRMVPVRGYDKGWNVKFEGVAA